MINTSYYHKQGLMIIKYHALYKPLSQGIDIQNIKALPKQIIEKH